VPSFNMISAQNNAPATLKLSAKVPRATKHWNDRGRTCQIEIGRWSSAEPRTIKLSPTYGTNSNYDGSKRARRAPVMEPNELLKSAYDLALSGVSLRKFTVNLRSVNISKSRRFTRVFYWPRFVCEIGCGEGVR
jgi:hypothetical protein